MPFLAGFVMEKVIKESWRVVALDAGQRAVRRHLDHGKFAGRTTLGQSGACDQRVCVRA